MVVAQEATPPVQAEEFGNAQILEMHSMGLPDDTIIAKIKTTNGKYDTDMNSLRALKAAGISTSIIKEMFVSLQSISTSNTLTMAPVVPQAPVDPNNPMAQYEPGVYVADDNGKLVRLELGKMTNTEKRPNFLTYTVAPLSGGSETFYFNNTNITPVSQRRPEFTIYISRRFGVPNDMASVLMKFSSLPINNIVIIKLEEENGRHVLKFRNKENLSKRFIRLKIEEVYKDVFKATPESDLPEGSYAIGIYDFDTAESGGLISQRPLANSFFAQELIPFIVKEQTQ